MLILLLPSPSTLSEIRKSRELDKDEWTLLKWGLTVSNASVPQVWHHSSGSENRRAERHSLRPWPWRGASRNRRLRAQWFLLRGNRHRRHWLCVEQVGEYYILRWNCCFLCTSPTNCIEGICKILHKQNLILGTVIKERSTYVLISATLLIPHPAKLQIRCDPAEHRDTLKVQFKIYIQFLNFEQFAVSVYINSCFEFTTFREYFENHSC